MTERLFRDVVDPPIKVGSKQRCTTLLSIVAHVMLIASAIIVPTFANGRLPPLASPMMAFVIAAPVPPPPMPPPARVVRAPAPDATAPTTPIAAPSGIAPETSTPTDAEPPASSEIGIGLVGGTELAPPPPPPPPAPPAPTPTPAPSLVRAGGDIKPPLKIRDAIPVYPALARSARVEGLVIIEATIAPSGRIQDARVLRSIPLLDAAALDAVRQWEYTPTLLNGAPVAVVMTVTVQFRLQ